MFVIVKVAFFDFLLSKFILFPLILILCEEKKSTVFYNNYGIHELVTYFCFILIDVINDYKNVYSRNNNVCLEGRGDCMMVFMKIDTFKKLLLV